MKDGLSRGLRIFQAGAAGLLGGNLPHSLRPEEPMCLCHDGRKMDADALAAAYHAARKKQEIVFFVHGLMVDETCWQSSRFNMEQAFRQDFDAFTVQVRYDSGIHISESARSLAELLEALHESIGPRRGKKWHIVAHSMGGLVTRSALFQAHNDRMGFVRRVDRVFLVATPNRGAPLEKAAQIARLALDAAPYLPFRYTGLALRTLFRNIPVGEQGTLAPVGELTDFFVRRVPSFYLALAAAALELRSDGIRDLRHGYLLREDWEGGEAWGGMKPASLPVPPVPWARYYAVAGSLSRNAPQAPSPVVFDGMVTTSSAANLGADDELRFVEKDRFRVLPGMNHFLMPSSPAVYGVLARWFSED